MYIKGCVVLLTSAIGILVDSCKRCILCIFAGIGWVVADPAGSCSRNLALSSTSNGRINEHKVTN